MVFVKIILNKKKLQFIYSMVNKSQRKISVIKHTNTQEKYQGDVIFQLQET